MLDRKLGSAVHRINMGLTFPRFGGHWIKRLGALPVRG